MRLLVINFKYDDTFTFCAYVYSLVPWLFPLGKGKVPGNKASSYSSYVFAGNFSMIEAQ